MCRLALWSWQGRTPVALALASVNGVRPPARDSRVPLLRVVVARVRQPSALTT